jgi:hypothetical protein
MNPKVPTARSQSSNARQQSLFHHLAFRHAACVHVNHVTFRSAVLVKVQHFFDERTWTLSYAVHDGAHGWVRSSAPSATSTTSLPTSRSKLQPATERRSRVPGSTCGSESHHGSAGRGPKSRHARRCRNPGGGICARRFGAGNGRRIFRRGRPPPMAGEVAGSPLPGGRLRVPRSVRSGSRPRRR